MNRFVFKFHKWLAVALAIFTLMWFVSGIVMALPPSVMSKPAMLTVRPSASAPAFAQIQVSIPAAITAAETAVGTALEVPDVTPRRLLDRIVYRLSTSKGTVWIDAMNGARFEITPEIARGLAVAAGADAEQLGPAQLLQRGSREKVVGPLPAYRIASSGKRGMTYFVSLNAEVHSTNAVARVASLMSGLHTFSVLQPYMSQRTIRMLLVLTSAVGTAMTFFGIWILWIQFQNWRLRRRTA